MQKVVKIGWLLAATLGLFSSSAFAYPTMIRHDYITCGQCHADPSGGSLLTAYGRAQGEILLRSLYGANPDEDPGVASEFMFGAFRLPEGLDMGGDIRVMALATSANAGAWTPRVIPMQTDLVGQFTSGRLRVNASVGLGDGRATENASLTNGDIRLISRHHWVGADLGEDNQYVLRFGRMNLPYGIRTTDHTTYVRSSTHTDTNDQQQHGFALAYASEHVRTEVMAIIGNLQMAPPAFRERGYSGFFEWTPGNKTALGVSSKITHADLDEGRLQPRFRHSHGFFGRAALGKLFVLSAEGNFLFESARENPWKMGTSALLQLNFEPTQGFVVQGTGEFYCPNFRGGSACQVAAWGTVNWYLGPHIDLRLDFIHDRATVGASASNKLLLQLHYFL